MKKRIFLVIVFSSVFVMGNKGCDKNYPLEHPKIESGMECRDCHEDGRTRETRMPFCVERHPQFVHKFGSFSNTYCYTCHKESDCSTCHLHELPKDHNQFWRLRGHGLMVGLDRSRCFVCHRADFCDRCHSAEAPVSHRGAWGEPMERHCLQCHWPLSSFGSERCAICHKGTPSHGPSGAKTKQPKDVNHLPGVNCRSCHVPFPHPDNGMDCEVCHTP